MIEKIHDSNFVKLFYFSVRQVQLTWPTFINMQGGGSASPCIIATQTKKYEIIDCTNNIIRYNLVKKITTKHLSKNQHKECKDI